jgi:hypothetical protein
LVRTQSGLAGVKIPYYSTNDKKIGAAEMPVLYEKLLQTNYPMLYGATSAFDDFAESFVSYIHTVKLGKPWQITIHQRGKPNLVVPFCWTEIRCKQKRDTLEAILSLERR